ncbi:MAG: Omp28-related outer membrane protein [Haliscomenobacter sp.]
MKNWVVLLLALGWSQVSWAQESLSVPATQQSLVTKLTATWCPICGGTAWNTQKRFVAELSEQALVLSAHISTTSRLYSPTAEALLKNFDPVAGQPYFFYNRTRIGSGGTATENTIISNVLSANNQTPVVQAGLKATINPTTREVVVSCKTAFFQAASGDFFLSFLLLEDSVVAEQSARSSSEIHRNVLRGSLMPEVFGRSFASGNSAKGSTFESSLNAVIPASYNLNRVRIAAVIWKKDNLEYDFVNVNVVPLTPQTVTSVPVISGLSGFEIWPNPLEDQSQISVTLSHKEESLRLEVVDASGKTLKTLFAGSLPAGIHPFVVRRSDLGAPGMYFVRLLGQQGQALRPLVVPNG